jgi:predicted DNA-binding antitoxin AbrB/MazE fold protein
VKGFFMTRSIKGKIHNGVIEPLEPLNGREGQRVLITFLEGASRSKRSTQKKNSKKKLSWEELIDRWSFDTGIPDLAHQHDHYFHGRPKKKK